MLSSGDVLMRVFLFWLVIPQVAHNQVLIYSPTYPRSPRRVRHLDHCMDKPRMFSGSGRLFTAVFPLSLSKNWYAPFPPSVMQASAFCIAMWNPIAAMLCWFLGLQHRLAVGLGINWNERLFYCVSATTDLRKHILKMILNKFKNYLKESNNQLMTPNSSSVKVIRSHLSLSFCTRDLPIWFNHSIRGL